MSSIDKGLDYDRMVMLTCKLLFAAAKAIVDVGAHMPRQLYLLDFSSFCSLRMVKAGPTLILAQIFPLPLYF